MAGGEVHWAVSLVIAWLPFLMLVAVFWYMGRQFKRGLRTKDGRSVADILAELTDELKRLNGQRR